MTQNAVRPLDAALPLRAWAKLRGEDDPGAPFLVARRSRSDSPPRALTVASVDYITRKAGRAAGLDRVHTHLLRHSAASLALRGGANLIEVRDLLGHASVITTSRYLHASAEERPATAYVVAL